MSEPITAPQSPIIYNPATKLVSVDEDRIKNWSATQQNEFRREVNQLNSLAKSLQALPIAEVPPPADRTSTDLTNRIEKLKATCLKELKAGKLKEAVKSITEALNLAMSRNAWESSQLQVQQVLSLLSIRCDINIQRKAMADAMGDASVLLIMVPQDWRNHMRKGKCLKVIEKYREAKECFLAAKEIAKGDDTAGNMLTKLIDEVDSLSH